MNILLLNQSNKLVGGSDIYFRDLGDLLRKKGHTVYEFYSTSNVDCLDTYPLSVNFDSPSVKDIVKYCYNKEAKDKLNSFIENKKIDVAHLNIYYGKLTSSILNVLVKNKIKIVQTLHEYKLVCPTYKMSCNGKVCEACKGNKFYNAVLKKCNRGSFIRSVISSVESYISLMLGSQSKIDKFICVSDFQKNKIIDMGIDDGKLTTVHNFFPSYKMNRNVIPNEGEFFLYLGRIEVEKGIVVFMEMAKRRPDLNFVVAGDGSYLSKALEKKENENIENINFVGKIDSNSVGEYLKKSIALVVPSLWMETFGLVILEAFNYSKPVIASRQGGMTEIVIDKDNGFLCDIGNVDSFLSAIDYLDKNKDASKIMGERGYHRMLNHFSEDYFYEKTVKIYEEVCYE